MSTPVIETVATTRRPEVPREPCGPGTRGSGGRRGNPWLTLAAVAFGVIMVGLDGTVVAIANPYIARGLHASLPDLQWVTNAYLLALAVGLVLGGRLGDRFGRRLTYLVGVVGFAGFSAAVGPAGSISGVIAFRTLQGLAGALLLPNTLALLRSAFPAEKLNAAVGIWGGSSAVAIAAGPIVGGLLVEHISWQSVFYLNVPVGALGLVLGLAVLAESRESVRHRFDLAGLATLALSLFSLVFGVIKAQTWGWGSPKTLSLLGASVVIGALFALVESRVEHPLVPLRLFRDRSVSLGTLTVLLNFFALFGVLFFVSLYLQSVFGYSPVEAGVRTLPLTTLFVVSSPLGAWLTGKFGPRVPIAVGLGAVTASLAFLTQLEVHSPYLYLWPPLVGLGLGIGLVVVASTDAIVGNTPVDDAGLAGGIQSTAVQLGGVLGSSVLGSVLATRVGTVLVDKLTGAGVPAALAPKFLAAKEIVAQGFAPVPAHTPAPLAAAITEGSHAAFMSGFHVAMIVGAGVAFAGMLVAPFIRRGANSGSGPVAP